MSDVTDVTDVERCYGRNICEDAKINEVGSAGELRACDSTGYPLRRRRIKIRRIVSLC